MRLTLIILITSTLSLFAESSYSQNTRVTLELKDATVKEALKAIENSSEFFFVYNNELINVDRKIDINAKNQKINEILNTIFAGEDVEITVLDRKIILAPASFSSQQPAKAITGKVTDATGASLPGASVVVKGTTTGVVTNNEGNYTISVPENAILEYSFVGMKTKEVVIGRQASINVVMEEEAIGIEEVVAVGYGSQKKVNLTGAVTAISEKELAGVPATSVSNMLQGKLPGVTIIQSSGQPGREGTWMTIRGLGTMNDSSPMVLIDGLESDMNRINPNDIESISVLKDAAAASIYGTRAANGVILITTKRGKLGTPVISYSGMVGMQHAIRMLDLLNSADFAILRNEANKNEGLDPIYNEDDIKKYRDGSDPLNHPNTKWMDLLMQGSGIMQNHNLSLNGGNEASRYMISLGYHSQDGLIKSTNHDRYNVLINLDSKVNDWINIGMTSTLTRQEISAPTNPFQNSISEFFRQANRIPNTYLNKYENGTWARHIDGNPIAWIEDGGKTTSKYSQILGSMFGEIKLLPGLKLKGIAGVNFDVDEGKTHIKEMYYGDGTTQGPNSIQDNLGRNMNITLQSLLNYEKSFAAHNFKGLLGISRESFTYSYTSAYRKNLPSNELTELNAGSIDGWSNSGYSTESRIISYFGRINYDYHGRYLLEANLRTDGSSKFAEGKRWGTFPSFSVGWRISNEEFMTNIRWINKLKLRGSWGKLGNHRIADYTYISKITLGQNYDFGGSIYPGAATTSASNAEISWETTTEMDLGIDAEFYNGKILFGIDYYDRYTDDILTNVPVSMIYGLAAPTTNAGAMSNKGFELQLGHRNKVDGLNYEINGYATYNKNIVEKYLNPYVGDNIYKEGYSWGAHYGYESIGIFQTDEEASTSPVHSPNVKAGDLKFKDQNNDGKIDSEDRVVLGNWMPSITYGINLSAAYKGVDFRATLQGVSDSYRNVDDEAMWGLINGSNAQYKQMDRAIVEDGKVVVQGFYPRTLVNQSHNRVKSSFTVMKADYLRLKNLQLGYNLPKELTKKSYLSSARIYVSGQNIFTLTKFPKDMDPENGSASYAYPQVAIYTLGLDLTF